MESLAYLHLALAYETSEPSESGIQLEQMGEKELDAEISKRSSSTSSLPGTQLIPKWVPSFKLNLLARVKSIALVLFLLLSSPVGASLCRCGYVCDFERSRSNGLVVNRKVGVHTRKYLKKSQRHRTYRKTNKGKVFRTSTLQLGSKGEKVVELKQRLDSLGYSTAGATDSDNVFNPKTQEAVKEFQKDRNLQPDGIVGARTNKALEAYWPSSMSARALFNRGLKQSDFGAALQDYSEAIKRDVNLAEAYYHRGMLYAYANIDVNEELRDINKALNDFTQATNKNPDRVEAYLERGIIYYQQKKWNQAIEDWTQVILIDPENAEAYYRRAKAKEQLKNKNDKNDVINDYIKVIELELKSEQDTYLKTQIEQAIKDFNNNKINPELTIALLRGITTANVSEIFYREEYEANTGEDLNEITNDEKRAYTVAIQSLQEEIDKNLDDRNNYQELLLYYKELNQYQFNKVQANQQEDYFSPSPFASAFYYQGIIFLSKGDNTQAKKAFDRAIDQLPNFTKAYYLRGIIRSKQGDEQGAISDYKKYLQGDPQMEEAKKMRDYPNSLQAQKDCLTQEIPKEYLNTLESSDLGDAPAYIRRGKLRFLLGDYPGSQRDFEKAEDEAKRGKELNSSLAEAYYQQGRVAAYEFYYLLIEGKTEYKKAREAFEKFSQAIDKQSNFKEAYLERGYLQYKIIVDSPSNQRLSEEASKERKAVFPDKTDNNWIDDSQADFKQATKIDRNFARAYYLNVVAERYKKERLSLSKEQNSELSTEGQIKNNLSKIEINDLTEAIRNDIYFYSEFIGGNRLIMKRAVCVELNMPKQDAPTKPLNIIPFKYNKEYSYYLLAVDDYNKKQYDRAINNINKAIELNPDIADYYVIRGAAYYFLKGKNDEYYKDALKDLQRSIALDPVHKIPYPAASVAVPDITYSSSISHFLRGRIIENQAKKGSQKNYQIALKSLPQADWIILLGTGDRTQTQNTASSDSARVPSNKCP